MADLKEKEYRSFEDIKRRDANGTEYWLARELAPVLEYVQWRNFERVIDRAMLACQNSGFEVLDHFAEVGKTVAMPVGTPKKTGIAEVSNSGKTKPKIIKDYKLSSKYAFSGKIYCGECGTKYRRYWQGASESKVPVWICVNHQNYGVEACRQRAIKESAVEAQFLSALGEIMGDADEFLTALKVNIEAEINDDLAERIEALDARISEIQAAALNLSRENRTGQISNAEYDKRIAELEADLNALTAEKSDKIMRNEQVKLIQFRLAKTSERLTRENLADRFDEAVFKDLVDVVTVTNGACKFRLKCGAEI
ncbi:hypothetical protein FACS1894211_11490 [Clostridia bacterium]|nr:hypothetical protein FACS1894211_11490 [Clostridia bacterium]